MNEKTIAQNMQKKYGNQSTNTKIDEIRRLDRKIYSSAQTFALCFGIVGALVLGFGMCLAMKVLFDLFALGIVIGVIGIAMVSVNYFIYKALVKKGRDKYGKRILELSEEIINA